MVGFSNYFLFVGENGFTCLEGGSGHISCCISLGDMAETSGAKSRIVGLILPH